MQTYSNTPDHGSSIGSFYRYVNPSITADMLFGVKEPRQHRVEIPVTAEDLELSWATCSWMWAWTTPPACTCHACPREPDILMPNNLGDVLYTTNFGMTTVTRRTSKSAC